MAQPRIDEDVEITNVIFNTDRQSELGRGSDAAVYRGTWHGAPVAVKLLHDALVDPRNADEGRTALLARFLREGQRLRRLRHPNIVLFLGLCRSRGGLPALVTEIMNGTLADRYKARPPLTLLQEFRLLRDVSAAMSYLHSLDIIHRDLTTRNVLVSNEERAKVADVGLSRSLHGDRPTDVLAMTQAPGTLLYMSPESMSEEAKYNQSLDIFSLGVLMMALILCREPDGRLLVSPRIEVGPSGNVVAIPEVRRRATDLQAVGNGHPLYALITRCLENSKDRRPSALALHSELDGLVRQREGSDESQQTSDSAVSCPKLCIIGCSSE